MKTLICNPETTVAYKNAIIKAPLKLQRLDHALRKLQHAMLFESLQLQAVDSARPRLTMFEHQQLLIEAGYVVKLVGLQLLAVHEDEPDLIGKVTYDR